MASASEPDFFCFLTELQMTWSFQLYSARNFTPWDDVLAMVAAAGYRNVEGFGGLYEDPAALRAMLDRHGLSMPTAHFSLDLLENDFDKARSIAETLGVKTMICPHVAADLRPSDEAGWRGFAARLAAVNDTCAKAGYAFAWHNHDFEFENTDGIVPMRVILDAAPEIGWEIDVAWVVRGGADPLAWIANTAPASSPPMSRTSRRRAKRPMRMAGPMSAMASLDWPAIMKELRERTATEFFIMEHDNPSDVKRFASRSLASAQQF
jgi:sugar phosphate isomerase/epimerase